jgi:DNA-binding PadR family transcriptional regulator
VTVPLTLLGLLEREPSHGYELNRDYDTYFGRGKPLPVGQVYATLAAAREQGTTVVLCDGKVNPLTVMAATS